MVYENRNFVNNLSARELAHAKALCAKIIKSDFLLFMALSIYEITVYFHYEDVIITFAES